MTARFALTSGKRGPWLLLFSLAGLVFVATAKSESFPVTIKVDAAKPLGELKPIWSFFGADEPNYATMRDGKKLLGQLGALDSDTPVFFRTHNLLTSGDGTAAMKWGSTGVYGEDGRERPLYDWSIVDGIFDTYRQNGARPYVQMGFMPRTHRFIRSRTGTIGNREIRTAIFSPAGHILRRTTRNGRS